MRESGHYPPGAEFDPRAPWNQKDPDSCPACKSDDTDEFSADGETQTCQECGHKWTPKDRQAPVDGEDE